MRTETNTIRPFFLVGLEALQNYMTAIKIRFSDEEEATADSSVKVDVPVHDADVRLFLPGALPSVSPLGPDVVHLVATFRDDTRRISKLVFDGDVDSVAESIRLDLRNLGVDWMGSKGAALSVYLVLRDRSNKKVGLPWFPGHILAMKHFSINRTGPGVDFPIEFRSGKELEADGFHSGAAVVLSGSCLDLLAEDIESMNIRILVNERLRAAIRSTHRSARGRQVRANIQASALTQLLQLTKDAETTADSGAEKSIGKMLVKTVLKAVKKDEAYWRAIESDDPAKFHSLAQAYCEVVAVTQEAR